MGPKAIEILYLSSGLACIWQNCNTNLSFLSTLNNVFNPFNIMFVHMGQSGGCKLYNKILGNWGAKKLCLCSCSRFSKTGTKHKCIMHHSTIILENKLCSRKFFVKMKDNLGSRWITKDPEPSATYLISVMQHSGLRVINNFRINITSIKSFECVVRLIRGGV